MPGSMPQEPESEGRHQSALESTKISDEQISRRAVSHARGPDVWKRIEHPLSHKVGRANPVPKSPLLATEQSTQINSASYLEQTANPYRYRNPPEHPTFNPATPHIPKQFVPCHKPIDVVQIPHIRHARVVLEPKSNSPLYTGGTILEGEVKVTIDGGRYAKRNKGLSPISVGRITVVLLGLESYNGKRNIFHSLAVDVVDENHPPPGQTLASAKAVNGYWETLPSSVHIPFRLELPVEVGPPPYLSRHASIRYILCASGTFRVLDRDFTVRDTCDIAILTVHIREYLTVNFPAILMPSQRALLWSTCRSRCQLQIL